MTTTLYVPGKPIAKKRPRFARRGKFVVTYNDQETEEGKFLLSIRGQWQGGPSPHPIMLGVHCFMPIPKSVTKKVRCGMVSGAIRHTTKPDLDNLIKFVKDCLNGVVWKDDSQVCGITAWKKYSEELGTCIIIEELNNET